MQHMHGVDCTRPRACFLRLRAPARSQVGDVPPFGADPAVVYVEQLSSPLEQPEVLIE
jgi:hypothetical protein